MKRKGKKRSLQNNQKSQKKIIQATKRMNQTIVKMKMKKMKMMTMMKKAGVAWKVWTDYNPMSVY